MDPDRPAGDSGASRSEAVLRAIIESPEDIVIFALDRDYRYLAFNANHARTMREIWGVDLALGDRMLDLLGREDDRAKAKANFDRALAGDSFKVVEAYGDEAMSRRYYEDVYNPIRDAEGRVIGLTVYLTDITEQRRREDELQAYREGLEAQVAERTEALVATEKKLQQARKLEGLGMMAGGIAHDFSNLLVGVMGYAEMALEEIGRTDDGRRARELVASIKRTARQAAELTDQLLASTGKGRREVRPFSVRELIEERASLLQMTLPTHAELELELAGGEGCWVAGDPTQVGQLLNNLVANAGEALGDGGGRVRVTCEEVALPRERLDAMLWGDELDPGAYVEVTVADDGIGMDPETLQHIFDPFFTTKVSGRGLGLAAAVGIVRGHGGAVQVDSEPAEGTTFTVILPRCEAPAAVAPARVRRDRGRSWSPEGAVLVADDDEVVRSVVARMLERQGLEVVQAADGEQCVARFAERLGDIRAVLLDLSMPKVSGPEALAAMRRLDPDITVVLFSGYSESDAAEILSSDEVAAWLQKPFELSELVEVMRRVLGD